MSMKRERNYNLDIVRIIAIFCVVLVHVHNFYGSWLDFAKYGWKGVSLFFILSGYLAALTLDRKAGAKEYYKRRILRIIPAYYVALIVEYIYDVSCNLLFNGSTWQETFGYYGPGGVRYLRYFVFLNMFIPSENAWLWNCRYALWTMPAFAFFYLIAPVLYRIAHNTEICLILSIILMVFTPWASKEVAQWPIANIESVAYQNPIFQLYGFMLGILVFLATKEKKQMLVGVCFVCIAVATGLEWYSFELLFVLFMFVVLNSSFMVSNSRMQKIIKNISDSSYTIYLVHMVILYVLVVLISKTIHQVSDEVKFVIALVGALVASFLFWRFIIQPLEHWLNKRGNRN